ncbi:hypothetical protein SGPA1_10684 [Streptomyces misionensis JCM 4497]
MLGAEAAQRAGGQLEERAVLGRQTQPAGGQHPQEVAVGDQHDGALGAGQGVVDLGQHPVGALPDLPRALARTLRRPGGDPVGEQEPAGPGALDLRGGDALVAAVVPLAQIGVHPGVAHADQLGGLPCPPQRADERRADPVRADQRHQPARLLAAVLGEGHVGAAGVPAGPRPLGLTVPDEKEVTHAGTVPQGHGGPQDGLRQTAVPRTRSGAGL